MEVLHLDPQAFEKLTTAPGRTVLVDFWATWCGPCQMLAPVLEELAAEHPDLTVGKVNVDEHPELAGKLGVDSIPALFLFKDGKLIRRLVGYMDKVTLASRLGL